MTTSIFLLLRPSRQRRSIRLMQHALITPPPPRPHAPAEPVAQWTHTLALILFLLLSATFAHQRVAAANPAGSPLLRYASTLHAGVAAARIGGRRYLSSALLLSQGFRASRALVERERRPWRSRLLRRLPPHRSSRQRALLHAPLSSAQRSCPSRRCCRTRPCNFLFGSLYR